MMHQPFRVTAALTSLLLFGLPSFSRTAALGSELAPGNVVELSFPDADLPKTLHSIWTGEESPPGITARLPDDYEESGKCPLLVYVPGFHGHPRGNISVARDIVGDRGWIVASVPLFKSYLDRSEVAGGILVSNADYPVLSKAYSFMLGRLFEQLPNIDREKSAMVGFSNGALAIAVLVSAHDEFVLDHFRNFCLVDHGMFHLTDLHKSAARDSRFLLLTGDKEDFGRDLKIRQGRLQRDAWALLGVDLEFRVLQDTGHEFEHRHRDIVGKWLRQKSATDTSGD